jgi:hypothetical protein
VSAHQVLSVAARLPLPQAARLQPAVPGLDLAVGVGRIPGDIVAGQHAEGIREIT